MRQRRIELEAGAREPVAERRLVAGEADPDVPAVGLPTWRQLPLIGINLGELQPDAAEAQLDREDVLIGSLLIGSSLVITTGVKPLLWGYPAIGIVGFLVSGLLGLYIVISTLRKHH